MIITKFSKFNESLSEGKAIGTLYHFTSLDGLEGILGKDSMMSKRGYISFSRNYDLNFADFGIRIVFDGERLSDKFKIVPALYDPDKEDGYKLDHTKRRELYKDEREERIYGKVIYGVKKYITNIDILGMPDNSEFPDRIQNRINKLIMNNPEIDFGVVNKFVPFRPVYA